MPVLEAMTNNYFPKVTYNDPPGIRNYYRAILYINGKRMPGMEIMDDRDTDGKKNSSLILFDPEYNGGDNIKKGDVIRIEMQCLDKGTYICDEKEIVAGCKNSLINTYTVIALFNRSGTSEN